MDKTEQYVVQFESKFSSMYVLVIYRAPIVIFNCS